MQYKKPVFRLPRGTRAFALTLLFLCVIDGFTQESAAAQQYVLWAEQAIAAGRWPQALAALERAADYAGVSSDLSFLLARARSHEHQSRKAVLEALGRALEADRWIRYSSAQARLLEAEQLVALRNYAGALTSLAAIPDSADAAVLRLAAFKGLALNSSGTADRIGDSVSALTEFRRRMTEALDRYPREPRLLRILFDYARNINPDGDDRALMDLALRRLPFVLEGDPDLSWMASPFIRDIGEARRLVASYRAGGLSPAPNGIARPNPASIAAALNLGLIDDEAAAEELFSSGDESVIDKDLILAVSALLRSDAGRNLFAEKLHAFSGIITADDDRDGYPESRARYLNGTIREYSYDPDQDGLVELLISFDSAGVPQKAEQILLSYPATEEFFLPPIIDKDSRKALVFWERYPSVLRTEVGQTIFVPRPDGFQFAPIHFIELAASETYTGLAYPLRELRQSLLGLRALLSFAVTVQRPSTEFKGAVERIDLDRGIPLRAVEILNGRIVSETQFENGRPVLQRLDLDLDSRMETVRRFRRSGYAENSPLDYRDLLEFSESDWNGDGIYKSAEEYREDGSIIYSWDMDGDGIREYSEIRNNAR